jgi:aryl-alcohol dehydrogenase-like predicted oxidoreductase
MISRIVLGTVQFGLDYGINNSLGKMVKEDVINILDFANQSKLNILDTAAVYGNSETLIGDYLKENEGTEFRIITKFGLKESLSPVQSLEKSLNRLGVKSVDTIMFHSFDDFQSTSKPQVDSLMELKGEKFKKLGISIHDNSEVIAVCEMSIFDIVQIPFNLLDNEFQRGECLKELKKRGFEVHTRSVFLQGLFFMTTDKLPLQLSPFKEYLDQIKSISEKYSIKISELALHYVLSKSYIDCVLIGVDSISQLKANLKDIRATVPTEAIELIDKIYVLQTELLNPSKWKI